MSEQHGTDRRNTPEDTPGNASENTSRNASRLLRIVDQDRPDWNASRVSRSRWAASPLTRRPHSLSW